MFIKLGHFVWAGVALFVAIISIILIPNPFKVTNPYSQFYNPDHFRFEDNLPSYCILRQTLAVLFPIGTHRDFVERVLMQAGGATTRAPLYNLDGYTLAYYYDPLYWGSVYMPFDNEIIVVVSYGRDDRVLDVVLNKSAYSVLEDCKFGIHYGRKW